MQPDKSGSKKKWTLGRYIGTALVLTPFSASLGGGLAILIWQFLAMIFVMTAVLIGANVQHPSALPESTQDYFVYGGALIGTVFQWWWLWVMEMQE